jgi:uncharacterized protein (TIGR02246 family)
MKRIDPALLAIVLAIASICQVAGSQTTGPQSTTPNTPAPEPVTRSEDDKAIRAGIEAFSQAFQKNDARTIAAMFTEDGEAVDLEGGTIQGRAALEEHYLSRFAEMPDRKLETRIESIKYLAPGIARETGRTQVLSSDGATVSNGRYTAIRIKRDGRWLIASVREIADKDISHHERLKELDWLVGDWVAETEEAVVLTSVAWTDEGSFLLRSFDVRIKGKPALTGTQRIGWDPLAKQIKSWVFDSRGGYGEGLWTSAGDQWVIKATGVRPEGRAASATQILTYVNKDKLRWKSIDRTLGDEIVPEIEEIVMVRKPPQPK